MVLDYMIWQEMYGSGALIGIDLIITNRLSGKTLVGPTTDMILKNLRYRSE